MNRKFVSYFYIHLTIVLLLSLAIIAANAKFSFGAVDGAFPLGVPEVLGDFISGGSLFSSSGSVEELTTEDLQLKLDDEITAWMWVYSDTELQLTLTTNSPLGSDLSSRLALTDFSFHYNSPGFSIMSGKIGNTFNFLNEKIIKYIGIQSPRIPGHTFPADERGPGIQISPHLTSDERWEMFLRQNNLIPPEKIRTPIIGVKIPFDLKL